MSKSEGNIPNVQKTNSYQLKSSDLTFGAGFRMPGTDISLDYAYADYDDLGDTHRVPLMTKF